MGQCAAFDPTRLPHLAPVKAEWTEIIATGDVRGLLQAPMKRLRLTTQCQLCTQTYQRSNDLSLHLQSVHASHWLRSQTIHPLLMQVCQAQDGCYCNPQTNTRGLSHTCAALRQLSMLAVQMGQDLFLPWTFTVEGLARILTTNLNEAVRLHIQQCLLNRQFKKFWTDPALMTTLACTCVFCGGRFDPAALRDHVYRQHSPPGDIEVAVMPQLVPNFFAEACTDHECHACKQIYNLPCNVEMTDAELQARKHQAHLHLAHQCPVLFQSALLLTHGSLRSSDASSSGGYRNVRGLWTDVSGLGDVSKGHDSQKRLQETSQRRACPQKARRRTRGEAHAGDGEPPPETGCRAANDQKTRLMDLLHANRLPSHLAVADDSGPDMEEPTGESSRDDTAHPGLHPTEMPPPPVLDPDIARSAGSAHEIRGDLNHDEHRKEAQSSECRGILPVPTLESADSDPADHQPAGCHSGAHVEVRRATTSPDQRSTCSDEVSIIEAIGVGQGGSMVASSLLEAGRIADSDDATPGKHSVEPAGTSSEAAQSPSEPPSPGPSRTNGQGTPERAPQRERSQGLIVFTPFPQKQVLCQCFEAVRLANNDNWCFLNSAFLATTWAQLSSKAFSALTWGPHAHALADFLQTPTLDPLNLLHIPAFRLLIDSWDARSRQGDAVEFLAFMLRGLDFIGFDMRWEVRYLIGSLTICHDQNADAATPIVLQFDPDQLEDSHIHLQHLIQSWSNQQGRQVALLHSSPLVCLQIGRCILSGQGQVVKSDVAINVHGGCALPIFQGDDLRVTWIEYDVVAQIAHMGLDNMGHCRSLLMTAPTARREGHVTALITDDWTAPERLPQAPNWFQRNVTCMWMCRSDQLDMYQVPDAEQLRDVASPSDPGPTLEDLMRDLSA